MKLRVGYEKIKGFSNPIKTAEEVNDWGWWVVVIVGIGAIVWMWIKIFNLYQIHLWLKTF